MGEVGGVHRVAARLVAVVAPARMRCSPSCVSVRETAAQPGVAEARDWIYCCDCYGCRCCIRFIGRGVFGADGLGRLAFVRECC